MGDNIYRAVEETIEREHQVDPNTPVLESEPASEPAGDGEPFDPTIHTPGPDGRGVRNKDGTWRRKRNTFHTSNTSNPASAADVPPAADRDVYRVIARQTSLLLNTAMTLLTGEPIEKVSIGVLEETWTEFYRDTGIIRIPSWVMAPATTILVCAGHCSNPKYHDRLVAIWDGIRRRKHVENVRAPDDLRHDRQRQNDPGHSAGAGTGPAGPRDHNPRPVPGQAVGSRPYEFLEKRFSSQVAEST